MEVVKTWKPELKALGFAWVKGAFDFVGTRNEPLQLMISIQKNLHADTYKINPSIIVTNPLLDRAEPELFLLANLRRDGIHLHVTTASWWPAVDLGEALEALKKYVLPWFQEWGRAGKLVEILETAISEEKAFIEVAEPVPEEATRVPWHQGLPATIRITAMHFYQAALLHYLNHDIARAIARTRDWIASLHSDETVAMGKAQTQLSTLQRISSGSCNS